MTFLKRYSNSAVALNFFTSCMVRNVACAYFARPSNGGGELLQSCLALAGLTEVNLSLCLKS